MSSPKFYMVVKVKLVVFKQAIKCKRKLFVSKRILKKIFEIFLQEEL